MPIKAVDLEGEIDVSVMDAIEKYVKVIEEDNDQSDDDADVIFSFLYLLLIRSLYHWQETSHKNLKKVQAEVSDKLELEKRRKEDYHLLSGTIG